MSSIVVAGNTSGSVTLAAPDVAGTTTLTLPATSGTVVLNTTSIPVTAFKNRIINGAMMIDQRKAGASLSLTSGATAYCLDRWYANTTGGNGSVQQVSNIGSYAKALRLTGASGVTVAFVGQKIESLNSVDLVNNVVTVSVQLSSSTLTSISWYARTPTAVDNYTGVNSVANGTLTINSTPTIYTFSFTAPSSAANGLEIYFLTGAFTSGTLDITGVQLEKGSTATSFDYRPYGQELALCQRYYYRIDATNASSNSVGIGFQQASTTSSLITTYPKVSMRASPTLSYLSLAVSDYTSHVSSVSSIANNYASKDVIQMIVSHASGGASYRPCLLTSASTTSYLDMSAEL